MNVNSRVQLRESIFVLDSILTAHNRRRKDIETLTYFQLCSSGPSACKGAIAWEQKLYSAKQLLSPRSTAAFIESRRSKSEIDENLYGDSEERWRWTVCCSETHVAVSYLYVIHCFDTTAKPHVGPTISRSLQATRQVEDIFQLTGNYSTYQLLIDLTSQWQWKSWCHLRKVSRSTDKIRKFIRSNLPDNLI